MLIFDAIALVRFHFVERAAFVLQKSVDDMAAEFAYLVSFCGEVTPRDKYLTVSRVGARCTMNRVERSMAYGMLEDAIERARIDSGRPSMYTPA